MAIRRINNTFLILIILCSASFYRFKALGPVDKLAELVGIGVIIAMLLLFAVYSHPRRSFHHFQTPVLLILLSVLTSMLMANYSHDQAFGPTLFAQRALYYYLLYFLLHRMQADPEDVEKIAFAFGIVYVVFFYMQYIAYPNILFEGYVRESRGTIRIYLSGGDYLAIALILSVQRFLRTNKVKYLLLIFMFYSVYILTGGRQMMAMMALVIVLFVLIDRRVRSKFFIIFLGMVGAFSLFLIFQGIFEVLIVKSQTDLSEGQDYIRIQAAKFFLTEFMPNAWAYITGNGASAAGTGYGKEITHYALNHGYFLGDIGLIGNYVEYGAFFVTGVFMICIRAFRLKFEARYTYIKYLFLMIVLSLVLSGAFARSDSIVAIILLLYIIDSSRKEMFEQTETGTSESV